MNKDITVDELRSKYIEFFKSKNHVEISGRSLIPENDPTVLFTTAGMHPLVPYLMGEPHPAGTRLTDVQKCVRTGDIDDVGDASHLTFFEMLGNWSLGDYFKKESISYSFEFLTDEKYLGIPVDKLSFTVFEGNENAPRDEESASIWESLGVSRDKIFFLPKEDNWWGPAGETGPCGPDTEIFIDTGKKACCDKCGPGCSCGKYVEIWNNVFMQYHKNKDGSYSPLTRKCVDTGMGVERTVAMLQGKPSVYNTEAFTSIIKSIEDLSGVKYGDNEKTDASIRIIADHIRTACFILGDPKTTLPSNIGAGYVLRRIIRRAVRHGKKLGIDGNFLSVPAAAVIAQNSNFYTELKDNETLILTELKAEEDKFLETLKKGEAEFEKMLPNLLKNPKKIIPGRMAFKLYDTYGFPIELTEELASESGLTVNREEFDEAFKKHQELSRAGSEQVFKGGLADHSEQTTAYHTATHLLHKALRVVLGDHVQQKGSNITAERLRFDFSHPEPMTEAEKKEVERLVNEAIKADLPVTMEVMPLDEAKKIGAMALFGEKYEDVVKVYKIGDFSTEVCGGPHVEKTGVLGNFVIKKEQSSSSGVRRIRAVLEH
ncbi:MULTISPECIES: alanine--tRNA ligase [unclassified Treponema]|uniref:alanine--tRNA ligase n=1 Tax=unclassified Treponema TaxID=2638727 RepID=UPI0020A56DC5|nr:MULTISPECIES: alanine--tRNA ligase [unclassified Treponema]UTC67999.1 alanine--tRNA ligase [Treponema sp. OMZ 789]UTC70721.1 alanine--tRNA ligase [Treponema sp. OMZ 790]UTC73441.1 alanine--tRNA ligase [Treponema sp. OMZ 791]